MADSGGAVAQDDIKQMAPSENAAVMDVRMSFIFMVMLEKQQLG